MFAAVSDTTPRSDRYAPFLPMYLSSVSDAIESEELTLQLQEHNRKLDELVKQRTHQLEIAKEIAEVASRGKDRFLAAISHDAQSSHQLHHFGRSLFIPHLVRVSAGDEFIDSVGLSETGRCGGGV